MKILNKIIDAIKRLFCRGRMQGEWRRPPTLRIVSLPIRNHSGYDSNPEVIDAFLKRPQNQRCVVLGFPEIPVAGEIINDGAWAMSFKRHGIEIAGFVRNIERGIAEIEIFDTVEGREILRHLEGMSSVPCEVCGYGHLDGESDSRLYAVFEHIAFISVLP